MKNSVKGTIAFLFCTFAFFNIAHANANPTQQTDQVAIQLGAIQLGIANISAASPQQQADALAQGRLALSATALKYPTMDFVDGATTPAPNSPEFRDQLQQAAVAALQNPVKVAIKATVTLESGKTLPVAGTLDPALTAASKIFNVVSARLPNISPGLVIDAIAAVGSFGLPGSGPADAVILAEAAMVRALTTYAKGTRQWGPISATSPSLPNFSTATVNGVAPSINGLMDAASAVAANTINALGSTDPDEIAAVTASLMLGAAKFQKISQTPVGGQTPRFGGAVGAATTGLVAQFAGTAQDDWNNVTTGELLNAVVVGAMSSAKKQFVAIGYGAAAGFAATYLATGGDASLFDRNAVAADILASFQATGSVGAKRLTQLNAAIFAGLNVGLSQANWDDPVNGIAGIGGIKDFTVVNGSGTPLTDTVGL